MIELLVRNIDQVWFGVAIQDNAIVATNFSGSEQETIRGLLNSMPYDAPFRISKDQAVLAQKALSIMKSVYDGKDNDETVKLATDNLPAYTQKVLKMVSLIPVGYVASYGAVAKTVGGGARAVGNIMASNPFAPIVPCHRVVSSSLGLGGYAGGLEAKTELLKREKRGYNKPLEIEMDKRKLQVFPVEFVLKKLERSQH